MNGSDYGFGVDTKTYSDNKEVGRHFMHLSFFAPGKDLHSGFTGVNDMPGNNNGSALYGEDAWMNYLQGIWGGGVFTGKTQDERFGTTNDHIHLAMEGNYDSGNNILSETPGPGVGYGYDENYRELHERQWDPTFTTDGDPGNKIRDFIRNLYPGSKFRFNRKDFANNSFTTVLGEDVYTVKKVDIKKLYNHTSWRKPHNRWISGAFPGEQYGQINTFNSDYLAYQSVEEVGLTWLNQLDNVGQGTNQNQEVANFEQKIIDFGAAHNRRLCYIIELDKDITTSGFNPLTHSGHPTSPNEIMNADFTNSNYCDIEFLDPVKDMQLTDLSKFPAIWELDPKKSQVDLDIYYEASGNIPVKINEKTNELFAPLGCKIEVLNSSISDTSYLESWDGSIAKFYPGLPKGSGVDEIDYTGMSFKFIREDGSYTIAEAGQQDLDGNFAGLKTTFVFREDIGDVITMGLDWHNCFSFGNGIESNRIKDDFNETFITNGVKASTTIQEAYKEERRRSGLIYSGIYNSNSGVNDLNQFIMAEKITKDLNPTYGSIQKLFQRRISLIAFCEDRVIGITSNKDAIYNADGTPQLISSSNVLGDANPFEGDYGISKNPESFASESYRAYFIDKQRGAVLRLSKDGLTPISKAGMQDWFRDNLSEYNTLLGTYDSYKEDYNVTLTNDSSFNENLVLDSFLETGLELELTTVGTSNKIENPGVFSGTSLQYLWELYAVSNNAIGNTFTWENGGNPTFSNDTFNFKGSAQVINHGAIGVGEFQPYVDGVQEETETTPGVDWAAAVYNIWDGQGTVVYPSGGSLPDNGWWYDPRFTNVSGDLFGGSATNLADAEVYSKIRRHMQHVVWPTSTYKPESTSSNSGYVDESNANAHPTIDASNKWNNSMDDADVDWAVHYPVSTSGATNFLGDTSRCITRNDATGAIVFDRVDEYAHPTHGQNFVEFKDIGVSVNYPTGAGVLDNYWNLIPWSYSSSYAHRAMYNGDEIHVQFELTCYPTQIGSGSNAQKYGYNFIVPKLELYDGSTIIPSSKLVVTTLQGTDAYYLYARQQTTPSDLGSDFESAAMPFQPFYPGSIADYKVVYPLTEASSTVTFPSTESIADLNASTYPYLTTPKTIICGASFKFRDSNQQNADGSLIGGYGAGPSGYGIEEVKVIDDLRIRISNALPGSVEDTHAAWLSSNSLTATNTTNSGTYWTNAGVMQSPLWEINNLKIKKGFGIVAPYTPQQDEVTVITTPGVDEVFAVPPAAVPAWSQVIHANNAGFGSGSWTFKINHGSNTGNMLYQTAALSSAMGGTYDANPTIQTGYAADGSQLQWVEPGVAPTGIFAPPGQSVSWPSTFQCNGTNGFGSPSTVEYSINSSVFPNSIVNLHYNPTPGGSGMYSYIKHDITPSPYNTSDWYLVDIELDENWLDASGNPITIDANGTVSSAGYIAIAHAGTQSSFTPLGVINPNGVGISRGSASNHHIGLVPVTRTEYGTTRTVLRAIYKLASDSKLVTNAWHNYPNEFRLMSVHMYDGVKIDKIIVKKLTGSGWTDWLNTNGVSVSNWTALDGPIATPHAPVHAFAKRHVYYKSGKLCWEVPSGLGSNIGTQNTHGWEQSFANPPTVSPMMWELSFTVTNNPITGLFSGKLRGFVTISLGDIDNDGIDDFEGVYFQDITEVGNYLIKFNFDGAVSVNDWTFERADLGTTNYIDYTGTGTINEASTHGSFTNAIVGDRIHFSTGDDSGSQLPTATEYAVSSILLTDSTPIFSGGSAGSWNFDGFDTSLNSYISWDNSSFNLVFQNCPVADITSPEVKFININQQIDKTINKNEKYKISFTHGIDPGSSATLSIYYYNTNGFGFKISGINSNTAGNTSSDPNAAPFEQIVTIGDSEWNPINQEDSTYSANLKNSFVIEVQGTIANNDRIDGYIDNIAMKLAFDGTDIEPTTVSFSEDVKGWTSFKSFIPDNGVSVSKKYFTFEDGGLYQHYVPLKKDLDTLSPTFNDWTTGSINPLTNNFVKWTAEEADNYNIFYEYPYNSTIQAVLNQEPSIVKTFNTINYEGSQTYIANPTSILNTDGSVFKTAAQQVDKNNVKAYLAGANIEGWECSEIKTDLDHGSIKEFIEKEGKWFNYIKGLNVDLTTVDTSLFSTQGIGIIGSVVDITVSENGNGNGGNGNGNGNGGTGTGGTGTGGTGTGGGGTGGGGAGGGGY